MENQQIQQRNCKSNQLSSVKLKKYNGDSPNSASGQPPILGEINEEKCVIDPEGHSRIKALN